MYYNTHLLGCIVSVFALTATMKKGILCLPLFSSKFKIRVHSLGCFLKKKMRREKKINLWEFYFQSFEHSRIDKTHTHINNSQICIDTLKEMKKTIEINSKTDFVALMSVHP